MAVAVSKETSGSPVKRKAPTHSHPKYIDMVQSSDRQVCHRELRCRCERQDSHKQCSEEGVEDKLLVQIHGVGATGSFRLATSSKKRSKSVTSEASDDAPPPKKKDKSPAKSAAKKARSPTSKGKKGAEAAVKKVAKKTGPANSKSKSASPAKAPKSKTATAKPATAKPATAKLAKSKGPAPKKAFAKKE
uniref:Histone H1 n=1 Tax=Ditylenchus dipsaci TaxID=166011 RepID=A0A915EBU2_9BILA